MFLLDKKKSRQIDNHAIENFGIPAIVLMENAAISVVDVMKKEIENLSSKTVAVICGLGNNGGDGFAIARHLHNHGVKTAVYLIGNRSKLKDINETNFLIIDKIKDIDITEIHKDYRNEISFNEEIIVDSLFGTGLDRDIEGIYKEVVDSINNSKATVISVDAPSGLNITNGNILNVCVKADYTVSFIAPKIGFYSEIGGHYTGKIYYSDISIPKEAIDNFEYKYFLTEFNEIKKYMPKHDSFSHKSSIGKGLAIAGSKGLTGAAVLLCKSCSKCGIGLLTLAIPESLNQIMEIKLLETMTMPVSETLDGTFSVNAVDSVLKEKNNFNAFAIGPGISKNYETLEFVRNLIQEIEMPIVLDADALNVFQNKLELLTQIKSKVILTPHLMEFSRIINKPIKEIVKNKFDIVSKFTKDNPNVILLLKGRYTLISENGKIYINSNGNVGMAKGGSGDVLTGIILSFLAQKVEPLHATRLAAFLHGLAGDIAKEKMNTFSMIATDLIDNLSDAINRIITE